MEAGSASNGYSTAGIILGAVAFVFFPIIFGPIGLILGAIAKSKGEPLGAAALLISGIGLVGGMILGLAAASTL